MFNDKMVPKSTTLLGPPISGYYLCGSELMSAMPSSLFGSTYRVGGGRGGEEREAILYPSQSHCVL